jgi:hypothetical protein
MQLLLILLVILLVFGGLPQWGYHSWGYAPAGLGGVLLLVVIVLALTGRP